MKVGLIRPVLFAPLVNTVPRQEFDLITTAQRVMIY